MAAADLEQAAGMSFDRLHFYWNIDQLKTRMTFFWQNIIGPTVNAFEDQNVDGRPVANWSSIVATIADDLPAAAVPLEQLTQSVESVYKTCWIANYLDGQGLITSAQATAVLDAYNGAFF